MYGVHLVVSSLTESYSCFYSSKNPLAVIQAFSVFYHNFVSFFQTHWKGFHLTSFIYVLQSLDKIFISDFTGFLKKTSTNCPYLYFYSLNDGIYYPQIIDCCSLIVDVKFPELFIQFKNIGSFPISYP